MNCLVCGRPLKRTNEPIGPVCSKKHKSKKSKCPNKKAKLLAKYDMFAGE